MEAVQKDWPKHNVVFSNPESDKADKIAAQIYLPAPFNMTVDESNVIDLMEYIVSNFGKTGVLEGHSPYDRTVVVDNLENSYLSFSLTTKRAVGCRYFVIQKHNSPPFHFTSHGESWIGEPIRHSVPELLIVRSPSGFQHTPWVAGIDETGLEISFKRREDENNVYSIPFVHTPTPKEISARQLLLTKSYYSYPSNFAGHPGRYDPNRLIKVEHPSGFWYLRTPSSELIITVIKDVVMSAMQAVFDSLKDLPTDERRPIELTYSEWLARCTTNYEGKEREKAIVSDSIQMLERISRRREELADSK
jgi:hypothetical protein